MSFSPKKKGNTETHHTSPVRLLHQTIELVQIAEERVYVRVVGDVVSRVDQRRRVDGIQPDGLDSELLDIIEPVNDTCKPTGLYLEESRSLMRSTMKSSARLRNFPLARSLYVAASETHPSDLPRRRRRCPETPWARSDKPTRFSTIPCPRAPRC